jgi:hypothetical protein
VFSIEIPDETLEKIQEANSKKEEKKDQVITDQQKQTEYLGKIESKLERTERYHRESVELLRVIGFNTSLVGVKNPRIPKTPKQLGLTEPLPNVSEQN